MEWYECRVFCHLSVVNNICAVRHLGLTSLIFFRIAFVQFNNVASAEKVMGTKDEFELEGRQLFIDYTGSRSSKPAGGRQSFGGDGRSGW